MVRSTTTPAFKLEHEMFILDGNLNAPLKMKTAKEMTNKFIDELLKVIDMEKLGPLQIYFSVDDRAPGWSFIQPITTSHISGHYFEKPGLHPHLHFDIYSCKKFSWKETVSVLDKYWKLSDWRGSLLLRGLHNHGKNIAFSGIGKIYRPVNLRDR